MARSDTTCWTVIEGAAAGDDEAREEFARRYLPVARAYLCARWRSTPLIGMVDDAIQEVFLDCFRSDGALGRLDRERGSGFKPFFYGVVRNIALRTEKANARSKEHQPVNELEQEAREKSLSAIFDQAWALSILEQAVARHEELAREDGEDAVRRVELLRLRFQEDLPIREIAARWGMDAAPVHKAYAKARQEFRSALLEVVAFHHPATPGEVERECAQLLALFR